MKQGDPELLQDPVSQELLRSRIPARLAYTGLDGAPRVVPIWFHWNGEELVMGTPTTAPKVKALQQNPGVALTIDDNEFPHKVLLVRGRARLDRVQGVVPEYAEAARRYLGEEAGRNWIQQVEQLFSEMVRISIRPHWVGVLDFVQRFPSAITRAMG